MRATRLVVLGLSHHTAPVDLREALSCSLADLQPLRLLPGGTRLFPEESPYAPIQGVVILSTCNRLELYAEIAHDASGWQELLAMLLANMRGVESAAFREFLYVHVGSEAVRHLCRVASGLDSHILGEAQILGQVTEAYASAADAQTAGATLKLLFETAIRAGKRARSETAIGHNPASTSSIALAHAAQILGDLQQRRVLVIGLGEMGQLALKALANRRVGQVAVANRTRQRAETAVHQYGIAKVFGLDDLPRALAWADVVISATAAPQPLINPSMISPTMARRWQRPLVLLDIAVPRNIVPAVGDLPGVHLFDADALQVSLDEALAARQEEVPHVNLVIDEEVCEFIRQMREMAVQPVIANLRRKAEHIRQQELDRALRHLGETDPQVRKQLQHLSRSLVNKLLHEPTSQLRSKAQGTEGNLYAEAMRELFGLPAD